MSAAGDPARHALLDELLAVAQQAARAAGRVAREMQSQQLQVRLKADRSEVSAADDAAQHAAVAIIHAARPTDGFITEETLLLDPAPAPPSDDRPCWLIDPIDGTRNYLRLMGDYCSSVGVMLDGFPVVGAIYDPIRDRLFAARADGPLLCDGDPFAGPPPEQNPNASLIVAIPSSAPPSVRHIVHHWMSHHVVRNYGATAMHLALVAAGLLDAAVSDNPKLWDVAAGAALLSASGMGLTTPAGEALFPLGVGEYDRSELPLLAARPDVLDRLRPPS